jgi:F420-dependent oxidoreductase-like protein
VVSKKHVPLKFGLQLGYWPAAATVDEDREVVTALEKLGGFDSVWLAESYGSELFSRLGWMAGFTKRLRLGSNILPIWGRTPTTTAQGAMTLDHLSNGRVVLALGVSGPPVTEGWWGQSFDKPVSRTREYIAIMRQVLARNGPVVSPGPLYPLPLREGPGRPLKVITHPLRTDLPILVGAYGPKNVALAAEIGDGWSPGMYSPRLDPIWKEMLDVGFKRSTVARSAQFEVTPVVHTVIDDDVEKAADALRPMLQLHIGQMAAVGMTFTYEAFVRMGYGDAVSKVLELSKDGRHKDAAAAIPTKMIEEVCFIGPKERIADRIPEFRESITTTLIFRPRAGHTLAVIRALVDLL